MTIQKQQIIAAAKDLGFFSCRFSPAVEAKHKDTFLQWVKDKKYGDMTWFEKNPQRRVHPKEVLPSAATVISLGFNYYPGEGNWQNFAVARYAWNEDYHHIIEKKLKSLNQTLIELGGEQRYYVDTGPVLERDFASASGLGWNGKSTIQIDRKQGGWFFLANILTSLDVPADQESKSYCGSCTRCITSCPTQAIIKPYQMDPLRCVSYFTIEHKGTIPIEFRRLIGNRLYGCDDCIAACPWNKFAQRTSEIKLHFRNSYAQYSLIDFLQFDDITFRQVFRKSPIKRIKLIRFLRNVCIVLGNIGETTAIPHLQQAIKQHYGEPLVVEHARWAIVEIQQRHS